MGLPTGRVTLVFTDIEGSTALLSRLGPDYVSALDGQRRVLRAAWRSHGGIELGTEGDSFLVVFAVARDAVAATAQAQRGLASHAWPRGERLRVRMGMHTGSPTLHDGGYVGIDVHRAARVAASAHGGQVVLSSATAQDVESSVLSDGLGLLDLGDHQLKDIIGAEHLFQLTGPGLQAEFPPLKTLGAVTSLPIPPTPTVGRTGEIAELTAAVIDEGVRLVTLTGPGGTGKTRLATEVARRLGATVATPVYFVPLTAVTEPGVMWTTIATVLDLPANARTPPGMFDHLAKRAAVIVLDNLEQLPGADHVVADLLRQAPEVKVIATSRRPLHLPAEFEHPVPPLELPGNQTVAAIEESGAVQLFVQQARRVRPSFTLTPTSAADVAALCSHLDGLPLGIELAAARLKLLTPKALLDRIDTALDITAPGNMGEERQRTLRKTIDWSYRLLTPAQQTLFRRLGVFSEGADLEAVTAVTADPDSESSILDDLADLVDASLVTVTETVEGEPRIGMLETIRAFALDQLTAHLELDAIRTRHARYYATVAEDLRRLRATEDFRIARGRYEIDAENIREALSFTTEHQPPSAKDPDRAHIGLRLAIAACGFLNDPGDARRWLQRVADNPDLSDSPELAQCLGRLAMAHHFLGDYKHGVAEATQAVEMARRVGASDQLALGLQVLGQCEAQLANIDAARTHLQDAIEILRASTNRGQLSNLLGVLGGLESDAGDQERSLECHEQALAVATEAGHRQGILIQRQNIACTLRLMERPTEAAEHFRTLIPQIDMRDAEMLITVAEDYAATLAELGHARDAAFLFGAADSARTRFNRPIHPQQLREIANALGTARAALSPDAWETTYHAGGNTDVGEALAQIHAAAGAAP